MTWLLMMSVVVKKNNAFSIFKYLDFDWIFKYWQAFNFYFKGS